MKKTIIFLLFIILNVSALVLSISCSNSTPNSAFIAPVKTIAFSNPSWTPTPTYTATPSPTATPIFPVPNFNSPYALAISSTGVEYVGDSTSGGLIRQYNAGVPNTSWPAGRLNNGSGLAYTSPAAMATDSNGNLYVVGNGNSVSKYTSTGDFSTSYSAAMSSPKGLACKGSILYVSDTGNNRIIKFASLPSTTYSVFLSGLTYSPQGLAIDGSGNVFVAATTVTGSSYGAVYEYNSSGGSVTIITGFNMSSPYAVALDSTYDLYVSDTGNHQIEEFTVNAGNYSSSPVSYFGVGILSAPEGIALDSSNNIYTVDSTNNTFYEFAP